MKISVIIPSLNEADTIQNVVENIDKGLSTYFSGADHEIINSDGPSTDNTRDKFLKTNTSANKVYLENVLSPIKGKGTNILSGLKLAQHSDVIMMIDADVSSITPEWIKILSDPVIHDKTSLVTPIYTRNRYEGNTTNHFSAPLINACFDLPIMQPIGGDFALSPKLVKEIIKSFKYDSDFQYGIDTLITWTAAGLSMPITQVHLGKKVHKPSFSKIVPMFNQVAFSTFGQILRYKQEILSLKQRGKTKKIRNQNLNIQIDDTYIRKPDKSQINNLRDILIKLDSYSPKFSDRRIRYENILGLDLIKDNWVKSLSFVVNYLLTEKCTKKHMNDLVKFIQPIYFKRVLNYFNEIENVDTNVVNNLLVAQCNNINEEIISISNQVGLLSLKKFSKKGKYET